MDGLLLTSNDSSFLDKFMAALATQFSLKDLSNPNYFISLELFPTKIGMFLSQQGYIQDLLAKVNMSGAKPVATTMSTTCTFNIDSPNMDSKLYQSLVGSLQYLALTYLDVVFFINHLAQHYASIDQ